MCPLRTDRNVRPTTTFSSLATNRLPQHLMLADNMVLQPCGRARRAFDFSRRLRRGHDIDLPPLSRVLCEEIVNLLEVHFLGLHEVEAAFFARAAEDFDGETVFVELPLGIAAAFAGGRAAAAGFAQAAFGSDAGTVASAGAAARTCTAAAGFTERQKEVDQRGDTERADKARRDNPAGRHRTLKREAVQS